MVKSSFYRAWAAWTGKRLLRRPVIVEREGRIAAVGEEGRIEIPPGAREIELGDAIVFPGFINAHCHLEYSCLSGFKPPGTPFPEWLAAMARERRARPEAEFAAGVREGIRGAVAAGTTGILDIFTRDAAREALAESGLRAWSFLEAIQLDPAQANTETDRLTERLSAVEATGELHPGLSPHTPYTVSEPLARRIGALAREKSLPLAIHLAETEQERAMVERGEGALLETFRNAGLLPSGWRAPGVSPVEWADRCGILAPRTLAIHGNYLEDAEIALLAARGASVAFCPKSHRYFGRKPHPLPRLIAAGVNVCIGTDSLASNDALDLLAELREARRQFPEISATALFAMIGANVARYLGCGDELGELGPGCWCDMTIVKPAPPLDGGDARALETILADSVYAAAGAFAAVKKGVRNLFA